MSTLPASPPASTGLTCNADALDPDYGASCPWYSDAELAAMEADDRRQRDAEADADQAWAAGMLRRDEQAEADDAIARAAERATIVLAEHAAAAIRWAAGNDRCPAA